MIGVPHQPGVKPRLNPRRQTGVRPGHGDQVQRAWVRIWPAMVFNWAEAAAA